MFFELNVILCAVCIGLNTIQLIFNYQCYLRDKAYLQKFSILLQTVILVGLGVFFLNLFIPESGIFILALVIESFAFGVSIIGFIRMVEISGQERPKKEKIIITTYLLLAFIIVLTIYTFNIRVVEIEGRSYFGLYSFYLIIGVVTLIIPQIHLLIISIKNFFKLYELKLRTPLIFFILALFFYLSALFAVVSIIEIRIIAYILLMIALFVGIALIKKYPNLLPQLGTSFAYQSLFIIRNNGQTLFQKEFAPLVDEIKDRTIINYLIGGFIYAISSGLKEVVKDNTSTHLQTMDFGKIKMVFYYGKEVFGVLFTQEANKVIYNRLKKSIEEFELNFNQFLKTNPSINLMEGAELSAENSDAKKKLIEILEKYFRG